MRNYKVSKCRLENLKRGDRVLSNYLSDNWGWYSFTFISIRSPIGYSFRNPEEGILNVRGGMDDEYLFEYITTFYKVEEDFPKMWGETIDKYNLNIIQ